MAKRCAQFVARRVRSRVPVRPDAARRFWIDVIGRHRRDAAPVVDACCDQLRQRAGPQVRRRLNAHARPENQTRHGNRPQMFVKRGLGMRGHQRSSFGAEILDDHFLDVAIARADRELRCNASTRSARVSPMPIKRPVVNGTRRARLPRSRRDAMRDPCPANQNAACPFRTGDPTRSPASAPWTRTLAQRDVICASIEPGIEVRQQARLRQHCGSHLA